MPPRGGLRDEWRAAGPRRVQEEWNEDVARQRYGLRPRQDNVMRQERVIAVW